MALYTLYTYTATNEKWIKVAQGGRGLSRVAFTGRVIIGPCEHDATAVPAYNELSTVSGSSRLRII